MGGYHDGQHDQMDSDAKELQGMRMLGQKDENMQAESVQISCETVKEKAFKTDTLVSLIARGEEHAFYVSPAWRARRKQVLALDRYECQRCKARGRYARAVVVHHVAHLKERPDLALSVFGDDGQTRQLVSVCKQCHEMLHAQEFRCVVGDALTVERWD